MKRLRALGDRGVNRIKPQCIHHWIIEEARGRETSKGACRLCGEERTFWNYSRIDPATGRLVPRDGANGA